MELCSLGPQLSHPQHYTELSRLLQLLHLLHSTLYCTKRAHMLVPSVKTYQFLTQFSLRRLWGIVVYSEFPSFHL